MYKGVIETKTIECCGKHAEAAPSNMAVCVPTHRTVTSRARSLYGNCFVLTLLHDVDVLVFTIGLFSHSYFYELKSLKDELRWIE